MILRVVADTNLYVSAIVFGGTCESILALAGAGLVDLFVSPAIQRELRSVLTHTFGWSRLQVREALAQVSTLAIVVRPATKVPGVLNYEPDHRILECALAARADFLV